MKMDYLMMKAQAELAQTSLLDFIHHNKPDYMSNWFHESLCTELEQFYADVEAGLSPRLMIFAPPRHGKSEIASRYFPAWLFGKNPKLNIMACSYSGTLANKNNKDIQRIIDNPLYRQVFPQTLLSKSNGRGDDASRRSDYFETMKFLGSYYSAGVGGSITGSGFDIGIIDDPIKDAQEAQSQNTRDSTWDWFISTFSTRQSPKSGIIIIMTRWNVDDLAGRLIEEQKKGGDKWRVLSFQAIADEDEKNRKAGQALHAERYPIDKLKTLRNSMSDYYWDSLYQQRPVAKGGNLFKMDWFQQVSRDEMPDEDSYDFRFIVGDTAYKEKEANDYTVFAYYGVKDKKLYLIDMTRKKISAVDIVPWIEPWINPRTILDNFRYVWIEDKGHGIYMNQYFRNKGIYIPSEEMLKKTMDRTLNKTVRANNILPRIDKNNPNVIICRDIECYEDFKSEMSAFPYGGSLTHDDTVDVFIDGIKIAFAGRDYVAEYDAWE